MTHLTNTVVVQYSVIDVRIFLFCSEKNRTLSKRLIAKLCKSANLNSTTENLGKFEHLYMQV